MTADLFTEAPPTWTVWRLTVTGSRGGRTVCELTQEGEQAPAESVLTGMLERLGIPVDETSRGNDRATAKIGEWRAVLDDPETLPIPPNAGGELYSNHAAALALSYAAKTRHKGE